MDFNHIIRINNGCPFHFSWFIIFSTSFQLFGVEKVGDAVDADEQLEHVHERQGEEGERTAHQIEERHADKDHLGRQLMVSRAVGEGKEGGEGHEEGEADVGEVDEGPELADVADDGHFCVADFVDGFHERHLPGVQL